MLFIDFFFLLYGVYVKLYFKGFGWNDMILGFGVVINKGCILSKLFSFDIC